MSCLIVLSLSLSVGGFPSCAFNLLCSYPAFMKCAVRSRRAKSRAGCRCRFLGRSLCAFGATPPQPSIDSNPLPPLVFRLTSATSATSLWTRVALSGLLLGRASTCSFEVVQIGLTFQRILGSRVFCFCFVSRRVDFSIFLEPKLCSCAAACSSFITCCGSRRRSGYVSY